MNSKPELKLDWCTFHAAEYAVKNWHYSKTMPASRLVRVGVWEDGEFVGCVLFGKGASNRLGDPYELTHTEICELVRIALREHKTPVSRIMSIAIKMLKKHSPGLKLIVSFADSAQNHHGGIYQATNWIFVESKDHQSHIVKGRVYHSRSIHSKYGSGSQKIEWLRNNVDPHATLTLTGAKHKYLYPLTDEMRKRVEKLAKPYPKRVKQAMAGSPGTATV